MPRILPIRCQRCVSGRVLAEVTAAGTRGWEDSRLRVQRLVELAGRLGLSTGLSPLPPLTPTPPAPPGIERRGIGEVIWENRGRNRMEDITPRNGLAACNLERLQAMLNREFSLESCLAWRDVDTFKVLLAIRRCPGSGGSTGADPVPPGLGFRWLAYAAVGHPSAWQDRVRTAPLGFTLAFACALAELAQATGLGLKICHWPATISQEQPAAAGSPTFRQGGEAEQSG